MPEGESMMVSCGDNAYAHRCCVFLHIFFLSLQHRPPLRDDEAVLILNNVVLFCQQVERVAPEDAQHIEHAVEMAFNQGLGADDDTDDGEETDDPDASDSAHQQQHN